MGAIRSILYIYSVVYMKNLRLTARLSAVASFVSSGRNAADIGTDHAYLATYLVLNGISPRVFACDINPNPLKKAALTVSEYEVGDRVSLILSDGLKSLKHEDADEIIIAGMGGETIAKIMSDCAWSRDTAKHYILQPMTKAGVLRRFLCENGYEIQKEKAVWDSGRIYTVMSVAYIGKCSTPDELFCEIGNHPENRDAESYAYIKSRAAAVLKKAEGLAKSDPARAQASYELYNRILECL